MTGLQILNALLIVLGPFVVVGLVSIPGLVQLRPARPNRRRPAARVRTGGWAVA